MSQALKDLLTDFLYQLDDCLERTEEGDLKLTYMNPTEIVMDIDTRLYWITERLKRNPEDIEYRLRYQAEARLLETLRNVVWMTTEDIEDLKEQI